MPRLSSPRRRLYHALTCAASGITKVADAEDAALCAPLGLRRVASTISHDSRQVLRADDARRLNAADYGLMLRIVEIRSFLCSCRVDRVGSMIFEGDEMPFFCAYLSAGFREPRTVLCAWPMLLGRELRRKLRLYTSPRFFAGLLSEMSPATFHASRDGDASYAA